MRSQPLGYRNAVLTDPQGRILAYVERLALHPSASGGGSVGLGGATFAPAVLERLGRGKIPRVVVRSRGVRRVELHGLRLSFHTGESPMPEGGWCCEAAVGTYKRLVRVQRRVKAARRPRV